MTSVRKFVKDNISIMREIPDVNIYRKTFIRIVTYCAFTIFIITLSYSPRLWLSKKQPIPQRLIKFPTDMKYILFWKAEENLDEHMKKEMQFVLKKKPEFMAGQNMFIKQKCSFINCYITYNKSLLNEDWYFDAIVFDIHEVRHKKLHQFNLTRAPHQKYIIRSMESAEKHYMCNKQFDHFFNLTWTYKLDSNIPHPLLNIYNKKNKLVGPAINMTWIQDMKHVRNLGRKIKSKTKAVAWIVHDCATVKTHKDIYKSLKAEMESWNLSLTTLGACGDVPCEETGLDCYKKIEKEYFFQLVTEDSTDKDFVTDKLVRVMQHVTIPIVVGDTDYRSFLPPGGYINANAFDIKKMGSIINYLMNNRDTYYTFFFDWKSYYSYNVRPRNYVCDLCAKLNDENMASMSHHHLRKWWNPQYEDICLRNHLYHKFSKDAATEKYLKTQEFDHM